MHRSIQQTSRNPVRPLQSDVLRILQHYNLIRANIFHPLPPWTMLLSSWLWDSTPAAIQPTKSFSIKGGDHKSTNSITNKIPLHCCRVVGGLVILSPPLVILSVQQKGNHDISHFPFLLLQATRITCGRIVCDA